MTQREYHVKLLITWAGCFALGFCVAMAVAR